MNEWLRGGERGPVDFNANAQGRGREGDPPLRLGGLAPWRWNPSRGGRPGEVAGIGQAPPSRHYATFLAGILMGLPAGWISP